MSKEIFHTDEEGIPAFGIIRYSDGKDAEIEFYNPRTGARESYPIWEFVKRLVKMTMG